MTVEFRPCTTFERDFSITYSNRETIDQSIGINTMPNQCLMPQNSFGQPALSPIITAPNGLAPSLSGATTQNFFRVEFAQRTFDAEGLEANGAHFSRAISWPQRAQSGVTIGRGYDMGQRTSEQIVRDLTMAGMNPVDARFLSLAALKRGKEAERFVLRHRSSAPILSPQAQKALFETVSVPEMIRDIQRIFAKSDTVRAYGRASWHSLSLIAQELVFDLRYRGDYTPTTRRAIQKLLVDRDYEGLRSVINDTPYWFSLGVPLTRIKDRQELALRL